MCKLLPAGLRQNDRRMYLIALPSLPSEVQQLSETNIE